MQNKQKSQKEQNSRQIALATLKKCEGSGQYSNIALDLALSKSRLEASDRALAAVLFYGVIERRITLDFFISRLSSRPLEQIDTDTLFILRLGIYQLRYLDRVPDHAAINETVALASAKTRGFVNAVLRSYTREKNNIELPGGNDAESISVRCSVGLPIVKRLCEIYGGERCESILSAFGKANGTTLRVNTLRVDREELLSAIHGDRTPLSPYGIRVTGQITELYGFEEGLFYVQDEASQLSAMALGAKKGETVIDVCSCPGSKSFGAAMDMENEGKIYSFDLHGTKLSLVVSSAKRLGINIIETEERDARKPREELLRCADRVICDVPCSGFGVLGKKPELRYKDPEASSALPEIQYAILERSAEYLKEGGALVYSTCTVLPEENEKNIEAFLSSHKDFELCPFEVGALCCKKGMITLLPDEHGTDGFFIAKLVKKA